MMITRDRTYTRTFSNPASRSVRARAIGRDGVILIRKPGKREVLFLLGKSAQELQEAVESRDLSQVGSWVGKLRLRLPIHCNQLQRKPRKQRNEQPKSCTLPQTMDQFNELSGHRLRDSMLCCRSGLHEQYFKLIERVLYDYCKQRRT